MEGFKNTTRMKTFGDEAPQAYAKGGSVKPMAKKADAPMKKSHGGDMSKMRPDQRLASMEKSSRAMTPAETRSMQAMKSAKDAAPKKGPLIKSSRQMTPAERRMTQMDRPTNNMGAEAYKGGGKVGGSKVPFAVKKVMRKAEGGAVSQIPEMPNQPAPPPPMISDTGSGYVPQPSGGFDPAQVKRMQELAAMMGNMPPPPQEPTPQSVFGGDMPDMGAVSATAGRMADMYGTSQGTSHPVMPSGYGTSPGPMPVMPNEPTPQSVFGSLPKVATTAAGLYGTSPGPSPTMPNEGPMPSAPKSAFNQNDILSMMGSGASPEQIQNAMRDRIMAENPNPRPNQAPNRGVPENLTFYNKMVKEALAARDAQNAAQAQAQQMQEQREAAQIRREAAPRFMR